jgi:hypothetical protein
MDEERRKRKAEYMKLYRQRKKSDETYVEKQNQNAERNRLYRQRKKADASSVEGCARNAELVRLHRQQNKDSAVSSIPDTVSSQSIAAVRPSNECITHDSAQPSASTASDEQHINDTTSDHDDDTESEMFLLV